MLVHPLSKVIISTEEKSFDYELIAFEIGCHGIVNVPDELEMLRNTFLTDELCYTKETIHSIVLRQIMHQRQSMQKCLAALTQRELQIAYLSSSGLSNCEIAEQLYISTYTVKTHMQRILKKLSVTNRTKLASILKR
ncbi:MAG: response regulator transcription factor [Alkalimonas sp.]|nr:response regulator transcription factor [Alkalimonas sp.]